MTTENKTSQTTESAIAVEPVLANVIFDDDDFDDDSDEYDPDDFYERQQEELQDRAMDCTCGAWKLGKSGEVYHVADCCCGAE
jgi:hypothetical protein